MPSKEPKIHCKGKAPELEYFCAQYYNWSYLLNAQKTNAIVFVAAPVAENHITRHKHKTKQDRYVLILVEGSLPLMWQLFL